MESNLLLEQYSWYKKQQLAKAPFECLLNADIEPNPHQVNAFCAAIQALKTGGIILADEVGLGKTIEAGLVLNYVLDNGARKVLISLPATLRKQWEVELLEKFGRQAVILDRYTVEHDLANVQTHLGNADEVSIVIASYDYSSKLIKRFPHVKWDFLIIDEAHNLRNVFHGTKRAKNLYDLTHGIPKILLTASLIENYRPFIFLDDAEKRTEYYSESDRNKLSGFLFRINLNDKYFWVYQHIYSVSRIDRSKNVIALFVGDTYDEIDSDIVQIDSRADVIIFSSSVVTAKMDLMQRFFGFEQYIRAGAQKTIEIIRDLDIVDSLEKFVAFENKSKLTNAKKLLKAKNSPVLQMKKNDLLENLKKHSRYKTMFKFEEDHIVISSQKEAAAFIKMLNDDIVRSELTGKEYDSSSKMLLGPVGASH